MKLTDTEGLPGRGGAEQGETIDGLGEGGVDVKGWCHSTVAFQEAVGDDECIPIGDFKIGRASCRERVSSPV